MVHCRPETEVGRSRRIEGRATLTTVLSSPTMNRLRQQIARTVSRCRRCSSGGDPRGAPLLSRLLIRVAHDVSRHRQHHPDQADGDSGAADHPRLQHHGEPDQRRPNEQEDDRHPGASLCLVVRAFGHRCPHFARRRSSPSYAVLSTRWYARNPRYRLATWVGTHSAVPSAQHQPGLGVGLGRWAVATGRPLSAPMLSPRADQRAGYARGLNIVVRGHGPGRVHWPGCPGGEATPAGWLASLLLMDAAAWDARYDAAGLLWSAEPNQFVVRELPGRPAGRAIDLGCGEGRNAVWLATQGWTVLGVDFSAVALAKAAQLAAAAGVTVGWEQTDLLEWRPEPNYDLVLLVYVHLPPPQRQALLARAAAGVAPGGSLIVVGHDRRNLADGVGEVAAVVADDDQGTAGG